MERWELVFNEATGRHEIGTPDAIPYCQFAEVSGEARAKIMVAAPVLLKACEDLLFAFGHGSSSTIKQQLAAIEATEKAVIAAKAMELKGAPRLASTLASLMQVLKEEVKAPRREKGTPGPKPKVKTRGLLLATRLGKDEDRAFRAMCKSMGKKPSTQLRDLALAYAGVVA